MITIRMPVIKPCPFRDEIDAGLLEFTLPGEAPELHDLARKICVICAEPSTHEAFTLAVLDLLGGEGLVVTRWHTGPFEVEVREGDESLARSA